MSQNLLSLTLTDAQVSDIDNALSTLETALSGLISLTPDQRRDLTKMGPKSEAFAARR